MIVDIDGSFEMSLGKFAGGSYVKHYHIGICNQRSEFVDICIFIILLTTGCS